MTESELLDLKKQIDEALKDEEGNPILPSKTVQILEQIQKEIKDQGLSKSNRMLQVVIPDGLHLSSQEQYDIQYKLLAGLIDRVEKIETRELKMPEELRISNLPTEINIKNPIKEVELKQPKGFWDRLVVAHKDTDSLLGNLIRMMGTLIEGLPKLFSKYEGGSRKDAIRIIIVDTEGNEVDISKLLNRPINISYPGGSGASSSSSSSSVTISGEVTTKHGKTLLFAQGTAASSGNNTIVSADASKKIKVIRAKLMTTSTTSTTCIWQSGAGGTGIDRSLLQAPSGVSVGVAESVAAPGPLFETAAATLLNLNLSGAQTIHYAITYYIED